MTPVRMRQPSAPGGRGGGEGGGGGEGEGAVKTVVYDPIGHDRVAFSLLVLRPSRALGPLKIHSARTKVAVGPVPETLYAQPSR
eukprot:scaffold7225_cov379-Prasinococcus_capsulatus_cf.AAC.15